MREALLTARPPFPFPGRATASPRGAAAWGLDRPHRSLTDTVACQAFLPAGGLAAKIRETDGRPEAKIRDLSLQGPVGRQYILTAVIRRDGEWNTRSAEALGGGGGLEHLRTEAQCALGLNFLMS